MKRTITRILALFLLLSLSLTAFAAEGRPSILDHAGVLSIDQMTDLGDAIDRLQETYGIDIVILTEESLNYESPQIYADDYYDENGYGEDGLLFLLAMEERAWYISTSGTVRDALTDYGIQQLADEAVPYFSAGDYQEGFAAFLDALPAYLTAQEQGAAVDGYADYSGDYYHGDREGVVHPPKKRHINLLFPLIFGLGVAGIAVLGMRSAMNTKRPQGSAADYAEAGSFHLRSQRDLFLYSSVTKTPIPKNDPSGGGGGSSVHTSSSGRSHGGGGGSF